MSLVYLATTSSLLSDLVTGHNDACCGGAIYDNIRNIIISVTNGYNGCRDVYVTYLNDGATKLKKELVPFSVTNHAPVYDGKKYVYFMEYSYQDGNGKRFGRIDLDTFVFEELPSLPDMKFAATFSGCFHNENVYAVRNDSELCCYNVIERKWNCCDIKVPADNEDICVRLLNDPHNESNCIYMMGYNSQGGLYCIDLDKHEVNLISKLPVIYDMLRDALLVQTESNEFIVV